MKTQSPGALTLTAAAVLSVALLAGCEKKETTTVGSPPGSTATTTTTTTVAPTPAANTAMNNAGDATADAMITAKVKTAYLADTDVKGLQIDVDTKDGMVTLNGNGNNAGNVDKAVSIAKGIDGVKSVQNNLTAGGNATMAGSAMDSTKDAANKTGTAMANAADKTGNAMSNAADKTGSMLGDAAITAKVKTALLADPDVKGLKVDVDTKDNVVTLSGTLDNRTFVDKAESIAKGIDGVKSVNNKLAAK